ncbi:nif-specific transcriptional activator NifA [Roseospirillum parvum]|nr:nif-specific transcriptional activator NifA [Roseospirillum parvum]
MTSAPLICIYEISKILTSSRSLDASLHDVLNLLSSYLEMRRGTVVLAAEGGDAPRVVAVSGLSMEAVGRGELRYPLEAARQVIDQALPMVVPDIAQDPMFEGSDLALGVLDEEEAMAFLAVPLKAAEKTLGCLSVARTRRPGGRYRFGSDLQFLSMVGNLISQALHLHQRIAEDRKALMAETARREKTLKARASRPVDAVPAPEEIIGQSPAMVEVMGQVAEVAGTATTVLIRGESGTGKELIARAIHNQSPRVGRPFIRVNCAALPETLLESELFGHEKGAFTGATQERKGRFEQAHGGTLFLDEIGEITPAFQAKLLRVLQEREFERVGGNKTLKVDVRLVCATNRNLEEAVAEGSFRADLYYRINVIPIFMPALRDRGGDIRLIARALLERFNVENGESLAFGEDALSTLERCYFPGNVRELENCVHRVATLAKGETIGAEDLACTSGACLSSMLWPRLPEGPADLLPQPTCPSPCQSAAHPPSHPPSHPTPHPTPHSGAPMAPPAMPRQPKQVGPTTPAADPAVESGAALDPDSREGLIAAMERAGWVQAKAARLLGLTPRQIGYALRKHNIEIKRL